MKLSEIINPNRMTPQQAAEHIGVSVRTLANWRSSKLFKLPYAKIGGSIRYTKSDLDEWLGSCRVDG